MNEQTFKLEQSILLSLLAGIHLSAAPVYTSLPAGIILLIFGLSLWQLLIILKQKKSPGKLIQAATITVIFTAVFFSYGHLFGQQPGIALVLLMTLMKLFETRTQRDCYIVLYSSIFIIASNFFHSQSVWLIIYVFFILIYLITVFIALSDRLNSLPIKPRMRMAARFMVYAIPFMLVLFVLFPRIPGPLWALPDDATSSRTGLSEEMSPGSINRLISSSRIAFRVKFNGDIPEHNQRYWRGVVLSVYDGRTWRREDAPDKTLPNIISPDKNRSIIDYTITLEPTQLNWLLTLEYPVGHEARYRYSREATLLTKNRVNNVINYTVRSDPSAVNRSLFAQEDYKNRLLPVDFNPRTMQLARQFLLASGYDTRTYIDTVLSYYRNNNFYYTLSPDALGQDAMDEFLFDSQKGFCEHYASSFVYLMRAAGIPARVAIGYMGGKMNPLGDYMIVRQSDAHAWAEVWIDDHWQRIDPTAAVSPDRVEQGIQDAGLDKEGLPFLLVSENSLLKNAAFLYDRFQNTWNQWVIGFDQEKQKSLLRSLGLDDTSAANLILLLVACLSLCGLIIFWFILRHNSVDSDRTQFYYHIFCQKFARHGLQRELHE
ncbi:MAG: DUF3488 domain-containing transglutaminase family protein, partial [Proteobacteria bacterium]|nr:DUF3488 domain-containing transglutaminase family protein [Pseudomonadota bacterium]